MKTSFLIAGISAGKVGDIQALMVVLRVYLFFQAGCFPFKDPLYASPKDHILISFESEFTCLFPRVPAFREEASLIPGY